MTPNEIEVLIHCHVSPAIHPRADAPAVAEAINGFVRNGILEQRDGDGYHTTTRGQALMEVLCSTPFPVEAWVDGNGNVIKL